MNPNKLKVAHEETLQTEETLSVEERERATKELPVNLREVEDWD